MMNDEETFIKIEAIESLLHVLETLSCELVEKEMIPSFLKLLNVINVPDEVIERMAQIIGAICFKLQKMDKMHIKYQPQILEFYSAICVHKTDTCRRYAVYNLPAMNKIYRKHLGDSNCFIPKRGLPQLQRQSSECEESKDEEPNSPTVPFEF